MDIWTHVAAVVDSARRERGLTALGLARQAGVDESTVRRVLAAEPVRLASLRVVASSLALGWTDLITTLAEPQAGPGAQLSGSHR